MPAAELDERLRPATSGGAFRTVLLVLFLPLWVMFWGAWCVVSGLIRSQGMARAGLTIWARGILLVSGIRTHVERRGTLDPAQQYVFLANHQSAMDIPVLLAVVMQTHDLRFMAKESLFKIPFLGWGMSAIGFIPIRRDSARHSAEMFKELTEARGKLKNSYLIFPEGTRSEDGRMLPLKRGTFGLSLRLGLPVVPVTMIDASRANPKGRILVRPGTIRVVFHAPISIQDDAGRDSRDKLLQQVAATIASALPPEQQPVTQQIHHEEHEGHEEIKK